MFVFYKRNKIINYIIIFILFSCSKNISNKNINTNNSLKKILLTLAIFNSKQIKSYCGLDIGEGSNGQITYSCKNDGSLRCCFCIEDCLQDCDCNGVVIDCISEKESEKHTCNYGPDNLCPSTSINGLHCIFTPSPTKDPTSDPTKDPTKRPTKG